jgi:hypothetical protein
VQKSSKAGFGNIKSTNNSGQPMANSKHTKPSARTSLTRTNLFAMLQAGSTDGVKVVVMVIWVEGTV